MPAPAPTLRMPRGQQWGRWPLVLADGVPAPPKSLGRGPGAALPWRGGGSSGKRKPAEDGETVVDRLGAAGRAEAVRKAATGLPCASALPQPCFFQP